MECSEADNEAASSNAVDSDGSVSWEDFFGTSTDLVPQLLGMFDELARRGNGYEDHQVVLSASCNIPAALQKRLSLVPHSQRGSIFGQLCGEATKKGSSCNSGSNSNSNNSHRDKSVEMCERTEDTDTTSTIDVVVTQHGVDNNNDNDNNNDDDNNNNNNNDDAVSLTVTTTTT